MKKLHLVALTLLLIGQMILGPIGIVSASTGVVSPDASLTQACNDPTSVTSGDTAVVGGGSSTSPCGKAPSISLMANLPTVDSKVIHTITATTNLKDPNYRPTMGEEIELRLDFSLPNQHDYGEGSTLSYPLPEPLKAVSGTGDLIENRNGNIVKYGEFKIDNGQVVINLNDDSRAQIAGGGSMGLPIDGYFQVKAKYELIDKKLEQDLTLPNNGVDETIQLNFKPVGGKEVGKEVVGVDNGGKNSQFVEWKVTVNTLMDDLGTGMPFSDTLTGKHTYDPMSLEPELFTQVRKVVNLARIHYHVF